MISDREILNTRWPMRKFMVPCAYVYVNDFVTPYGLYFTMLDYKNRKIIFVSMVV